MIDFIVKYWIEAVFALILAGFGALFRMFYKRIKEQLAGQKTMQKALTSILHDTLYRNTTIYLANGYISTDELENLRELYEAYHCLGGNGTGTVLYERCTKLKIKEGEKK